MDHIHTRLENSWMKKTNQNNDQVYFKNIYLIVNKIKNKKFNF